MERAYDGGEPAQRSAKQESRVSRSTAQGKSRLGRLSGGNQRLAVPRKPSDRRVTNDPLRGSKRAPTASCGAVVFVPEEVQAAGVFTASIDPKITTFGLLGICTWLPQWYQPAGQYAHQHIAGLLAQIAANGLVVSPLPGSN